MRARWINRSVAAAVAIAGLAAANLPPSQAVPGEPRLVWCSGTSAHQGSFNCITWNAVPTATRYTMYFGTPAQLPLLLTPDTDSCSPIAPTSGRTVTAYETPGPGSLLWYLVIAENTCGSGPAGDATAGPRLFNPLGTCGCRNGVKDSIETDVDCGGPFCFPCAASQMCNADTDCASGLCVAAHCRAPACTDAVQNGSETGVDCGGSCAPCPNGQGCCVAGDCQSGACAGDVCMLPSCLDGVQDGAETDVDCGGSGCPACAAGRGCGAGMDCADGVCSPVTHVCQPPACTDAVQNGEETDVDCGGGACAPCAYPQHCVQGGDCQSGTCGFDGICQPPWPNGLSCWADYMCQSGHCVDGVCCNTACTGTCQACSDAKKGTSHQDGICGCIHNFIDPDNECPGASTCNGAGACTP